MRVTDNSRLLSALRNNTVSTERLTTASRRAAVGAKVVSPSDDPVAYTAYIRRTSSLANLSSRTRIARTAADQLTVGERALDSASDLLAQARALAVQGSTESLSGTDRQALSQQVLGIRAQLLGVANTRGVNGYVFGGSKTDTPPFDDTGNFSGNDTVLRVPVADGVSPKSNMSGARAFTSAGGTDVFASLSALATSLSTSDLAGIRSSVDAMQASADQVVSVQVDAGLSIERLQSSADVMDAATLAVSQSQARDVGADDQAGLATELAAASSAYSQSLAVTKKLLSLPTLATTT